MKLGGNKKTDPERYLSIPSSKFMWKIIIPLLRLNKWKSNFSREERRNFLFPPRSVVELRT